MPPKQSEITDSHDKDGDAVTYWHAMSKEEAIATLGLTQTNRLDGLPTGHAIARLEKYGPNKLTEKEKVTLLMRIWKQVNNVLVGILVFVALVSLAKGITTSGEDRVTNFIEVGLITFVIT